MTEAEWSSCADPTLLLEAARCGASDRKLRLFACACCRQAPVWHYLTRPTSRAAVAASEQFADGMAGAEQLEAARTTAPKGSVEGGPRNAWFKVHLSAQGQADRAVLAAASWSAWEAAWDTSRVVVNLLGWREQSELLRDVFGNPFRPVAPDLSRPTPAVASLARAVYDERAFHRMLELADALKKAGCADADTLAHCRVPGPHVRGCWVVDVILGRL